MSLAELFIIAVGLSMDAFAVSVCKGLALGKVNLKQALVPGLWFGGFQALMPLIGYLLGYRFEGYIKAFDHWIAFILLGIIGINMIREALSGEEDAASASLSPRVMFPMALATSIDALAVGVTFSFLSVDIVPAVAFIGCTTFVFGAAGMFLGTVVGSKFQQKAQLFGGAILVLMGIKILLEHLGFWF